MPPEALATAAVAASAAPFAAKLTEPGVRMLDDVVAIASSSSTAIASAAPTAALPPAAEPLASVSALDNCVASTATLPLTSSPFDSAPIDARVRSDASVSAITGVTATPPADPCSAWVTMPCTPNACSVTSPAPDSDAPSASSAVERVATRLSATDAPTPTLPPDAPDPEGPASDVAVERFAAVSETEPPERIASGEPNRARLSESSRFVANAPATPTLVAAAPEVAFTAKLLSAAAPVIVADSVRPEVWIRCCSKALFETCDRPTATPTPTPVDPEALDPSAKTLEELPVVVVRLVAPMTTAFTDDDICASVFEVTSAIESAPAAFTAPSLVDS